MESIEEKEYMHLRKKFLERAKRAEKAGIKEASIYLKGGYEYLPSISEIKQTHGRNIEEMQRVLKRRLERVSDLLTSGTVSLEVRRAKQIERDKAIVRALKSSGLEHIARTNLKKFGQFMDAMRERYGRRLPDSFLMAEFFDNLKYNAKRKSLDEILKIWEAYEKNGYEPNPENYDVFRS